MHSVVGGAIRGRAFQGIFDQEETTVNKKLEGSDAGESGAPPTPPEQPAQATIKVDDSNATAGYANFCRVSSTPEELILDLGLNPQPYSTGETTVRITQRIIMNHFTAKRLLNALGLALQRHETAFGVLETDVRKRVRTTQ